MLVLLLMASLTPIECPNYLPGTNRALPAGVELAPQQRLNNSLRCYCEVVVPAEGECKLSHDHEQCERRTQQWIDENFVLPTFPPRQAGRGNTTRTLRMISIEP